MRELSLPGITREDRANAVLELAFVGLQRGLSSTTGMSRLVPAWYLSYSGHSAVMVGQTRFLSSAVPGARPDGQDLVPHLDLHVGVRDQVPVPSGVLRRAPLRCHDDVVIVVPTVDERELPDLAGPSARRVQDEDGRTVPVVPDLAAGGLVLPDVLGAE